MFLPINVNASETSKARIGNEFFDTLEEAINMASSTDVISLTNNVTLNKPMEIKKSVNINLNGNDISAPEKVFLIQGGSLKLTGKGTIKETNPNYGAIMLMGSDDDTKNDFSTVVVDKDVTLIGWSGIFIDHNNKTGYGITVSMNGTINAINDVSGGSGIGVYVNGNIKHQTNSPVINLGKTAKITSTGNGIYAAGYSIYNINGAYIEGKEAGLGIKSGIFNINNGTIVGTGEDKTPTGGNNNGINPTGVAIQIESNSKYAGDIELYIKNGTINSKNSNVIYEYTTKNTESKVKNISITGGKFVSDANKNVFLLSNSFVNKHLNFISGGSFSSDPENYLKSGYSTSKKENLYTVVSSTMSVFSFGSQNSNTSLFIIPILIIILGVTIYIYRNKISDFFYKARKK